jgi:hypothetical protein
LLEYDSLQSIYNDRLAAHTELAATNYTGMPHASGVGNPTNSKAMDAIYISELADAIAVVQAVHRILSPKQAIFLQARRDANIAVHDTVGRPGWVQDTQDGYTKAIYYQYGYYDTPCDQTVIRWWSQILDLTARIAGRMGKKII